MDTSYESRILAVFRETFDDSGLKIERQTTASQVEGWDSLAHVNLLFSLEQEFGIKFPLGQTNSLKNVGDLMDVIQRLSEQRAAKTAR